MCLPLPSFLTRRRREKVYYPVPPEPDANAVSSWTYVPPSRPYTPPATIRPPTLKPSKAIYFTPDGKYTDD
ncbi:Protein of unknown function [Pyronema omphalodes CBS 100304]|uniref:Uncharacterized protein n=1 Tax=Pyronema omphalodes (strain CBS 100304) TaxID=1076935 RepID=U4LHV9_PYROM|nr:Protein of unknown function [Pyronema omphalodes CBS 100304]